MAETLHVGGCTGSGGGGRNVSGVSGGASGNRRNTPIIEESSESDNDPEPAKMFQRRLSTKKTVSSSVSITSIFFIQKRKKGKKTPLL